MPLDRRRVFLLRLLFLEAWQHPGCGRGRERREGSRREAGRGEAPRAAGVWGTAGSSEPPSQLSPLLRLSGCYAAGAARPASRPPLHKGSGRPRQRLALDYSSPDARLSEVRRQVWKASQTLRAPATSPKLCYRPRRKQPVSPRRCDAKASGCRGWHRVGLQTHPALLPAILWEADRCSPSCGGEGLSLAELINFIPPPPPPPLGWKPCQGSTYKTPGDTFPPLVVYALGQESTGRFSQRRSEAFHPQMFR